MYEKIFFVVLGVLLKWLVDIYVQKSRIDDLQQILIEELEDIKERLQLICGVYENGLKALALKGILPNLPVRLPNPVYQKHYTEVALRFGASQRKSFSLIHSYVESINRGIDKLESVMPSDFEDLPTETLERWGSLLKAQYRNAASVYWHVSYHLANRELPMLGGEGTPEHEAFTKQAESINEHIKRILKEAPEQLTRADFEKLL